LDPFCCFSIAADCHTTVAAHTHTHREFEQTNKTKEELFNTQHKTIEVTKLNHYQFHAESNQQHSYYNIQERREKLEAQMHQASKEHASMEVRKQISKSLKSITNGSSPSQNELAALQLQLAKMQTSQAGEEDTTDQEPLREKQKAEERLQRIIRRCELYVQRHQMLKEMGIRGRRGH